MLKLLNLLLLKLLIVIGYIMCSIELQLVEAVESVDCCRLLCALVLLKLLNVLLNLLIVVGYIVCSIELQFS